MKVYEKLAELAQSYHCECCSTPERREMLNGLAQDLIQAHGPPGTNWLFSLQVNLEESSEKKLTFSCAVTMNGCIKTYHTIVVAPTLLEPFLLEVSGSDYRGGTDLGGRLSRVAGIVSETISDEVETGE